MERARHELLARAALAVDQDRRAAGRCLDDQVEHLPHAGASADDLAEPVGVRLEVLPERAVLGDEPPLGDGVPQHAEHFVVLEGLRDVVERPALDRRDRVLDRRERGNHQDRKVVVYLLELVERRNAIHARHHHVHDGRVEGHGPRELEALGRVLCEPDAVTLTCEEGVEDLAHDLLVVDDQNGAVTIHSSCPGRLVRRAPPGSPAMIQRVRAATPVAANGSDRLNLVPCPGALSHAIVPPCSCTIPYVIDSPRPVPLPISFVVKKGS